MILESCEHDGLKDVISDLGAITMPIWHMHFGKLGKSLCEDFDVLNSQGHFATCPLSAI